MEEEKQKDYFITRYSLIPDAQMDIAATLGITKEMKFNEWLLSFQKEKRKEIAHRGTNYVLYCKRLSEHNFFMSFAKELKEVIGQKTEDGIVDTPVENYKKCNIFINTKNQWMVIEKNADISSSIESQKNIIANVILKFMAVKDLYFELNIMAEKNYFWDYVAQNQGTLTDVEITLSSPNFLDGIKTVNEFLHKTNEKYNNTSISLHLKNEDGRLYIDSNNPFLQNAIEYASAGGGKWKIKSIGDKKGCSNVDNPFVVRLPENIGDLKSSDIETIENTFERIKRIDQHRKE